MYIPPAFAETDRQRLFEFIAEHSFGLLVSGAGEELVATHLPLLVERQPREKLVGHLARANPQARALADQQVLCVFSGPHAYISPRWYQADEVVPTWNYLAVHVIGRCRVIDDEKHTAAILERFVATYEREMREPWTFDVAAPCVQKLVRQVVAFEIEIERIEGKWKLGQNLSPQSRENAARGLDAQGDEASRTIARLMRATLESGESSGT